MVKLYFNSSPTEYDGSMIPLLPGWQRRYSGDITLFIHPNGPAAAAVHYQERLRPLQRMRDLVDLALSRRPMFRVDQALPVERILTTEGEYAAHAVLRGQIEGRPAECHVGAVFGDDFQSLLQGVVTQPSLFADFHRDLRALISQDSLGLGRRRRRFVYAPPPGWQGLPRSFSTEWFPPDFPRDPSSITVFPANPALLPPAELLQQLIQAEQQVGQVTLTALPKPDVAPSLLAAQQRVGGRSEKGVPFFRQWAALADAHYCYIVQLESLQADGLSRHERAFWALLRSIEPLPAPEAPAVPVSAPRPVIDLWGTD